MKRLLLFLVLAMALTSTCASAAERPNIILVLTDDMGPGDLGCYGGKLVPTPNIDRMAQEGTRFGQYYSASPICSPSRTGILTGQYPARWRINSFLQAKAGNRGCEQADYLDPSAPSLARTLKAAGYATGHFGKWHMGGGRDVTNAPKFAVYGFDEHASTYESPEPHRDITGTNWIWSRHDKVKRWDRSAFFVDRTLDFLERHAARGRPCFVNLWPDDVHTPWVPSDESDQRPTRANLRAVIDEYDRQVGRLFDGLRRLGMDTNTLVIFTSDNGALPTFGGDRSAGLRGSKLSLYEGGIRMPFIVRWPGRVPAGRTDEASVLHATDLFPTLCAISGVPVPKDTVFDGQDSSAAFFGKTVALHKPVFWEYGRNEKFFAYPKGPDRSPTLAGREGKWKLLINADGTGAELYDLAVDRAETNNLADREETVRERMVKQVLEWRKLMP